MQIPVPTECTPAPPLPDAGQIVRLLVRDGLLTDEQVQYAQRIQSKLDSTRRLLSILEELDYVKSAQVKEVFRRHRAEIRIGDLLVELGYVSEKQLALALEKQRQMTDKKRLGEVLVDHKYISEYDLVQVLSMHLGFPVVEPKPEDVEPAFQGGHLIPIYLKHQFLPVGKSGGAIRLAMADPLNGAAVEAAKSVCGPNVSPHISLARQIQEALDILQRRDLAEQPAAELVPDKIVEIVDRIILDAVRKQASDIHIEPMKNRLRVRFRKDGSLILHRDFPKEYQLSIANRIKVMAAANLTERRRHQDGRILLDPSVYGQEIDLRVSIYISFYGEHIVLRLLTKRSELLKVEDLGMAPKVLERFRDDVLDLPTGVVIITGPTGAGKTTTLYSAINYSNRIDQHIVTAEEPVEYVIEGVTQCSINPKLGVTFEETLRHILRQDPDIIVLGEIRDKFSAESAIQAALTGHKVLTTFHTEDTIGGLLRLMNMDIETFLISSTVVSVVAQRLIKKVCPHCREKYSPSPRDLRRLRYQGKDLNQYEFTIGSGCEQCDFTGYLGRVGVFELLVLNEYVKEAILLRKPSTEIRRISLEITGLVTLLEDGLGKAAKGITSLQEIIRTLPVLEPPRSIEQIYRLVGEVL